VACLPVWWVGVGLTEGARVACVVHVGRVGHAVGFSGHGLPVWVGGVLWLVLVVSPGGGAAGGGGVV
jgi:hypothetical protein